MEIKLDNRPAIEADLVDAEVSTPSVTYLGFIARNINADDLTQVAIAKIDNTVAGITIIKWANGTQNFNNAWANRAALTYTHLTQ